MLWTIFLVILYFFAYLIVSRQVGFLLFYLIHGETYPEYGYKDNRPATEYETDPTPWRITLWIPIFGDILSAIYFLIILAYTAFSILADVFILDKKLEQLIAYLKERAKERKERKEAKKLSKQNIYDFAKKNPEDFRKAIEEVERLERLASSKAKASST